MKIPKKHLILYSALLMLIFPAKAHAYLDPGTGSYLLQIMTAALFGGVFLVTTWWKQIKHFFLRLFHRKDKSTSEKTTDKAK